MPHANPQDNKREMGEARAWSRVGYIAVPLQIEHEVVGTFLKDLNGALRSWYLERLGETRTSDSIRKKIANPEGPVERVREYLEVQRGAWGTRHLPFLDDIWNLPADWSKTKTDDASLMQYARQGAEVCARGNSYKCMVLNGFGFISHVYGLRFVWALLPDVFEALREYEPEDRLHLTGLPHLIIKPPRTGPATKLAAHVDGGSLRTMLDRCRDVLSDQEPTVDTWVRRFGFQSLVHVVGSNGHTSILGPMTVARYALVLSMIQSPFTEAVLPESDDDWLRHPDMETCFDLGRGGSVKRLSVIVDAFISRLAAGGKRKSEETSASAAKKLITADAAEKVVAALRTLYEGDADAKIRDFRTACRAHIGEAAAEVAPPTSARSAMYVVRKYLANELDTNCKWSEDPPSFCDILYNPKCIAVLNRVMRAVVTCNTTDVDAAWIRKWQATDIGHRATVVLREEGRTHTKEMGVIPITTGSLDHLPYIAMWPDGFIHGSNAMETGPRVSIAIPVATASRLDEPWATTIGPETHRGRIRRGIERVDALAAGDFETVRKERAVYATGPDDARHFAGLYVTREEWAGLKSEMMVKGILPAARGDRVLRI